MVYATKWLSDLEAIIKTILGKSTPNTHKLYHYCKTNFVLIIMILKRIPIITDSMTNWVENRMHKIRNAFARLSHTIRFYLVLFLIRAKHVLYITNKRYFGVIDFGVHRFWHDIFCVRFICSHTMMIKQFSLVCCAGCSFKSFEQKMHLISQRSSAHT